MAQKMANTDFLCFDVFNVFVVFFALAMQVSTKIKTA